jgi:hypothetical protein
VSVSGPRHDVFVVLGSEAFCGNLLLKDVHAPDICADEPCVIHHPTDHGMRAWPLIWLQTVKAFYRICEHRLPHPDPDQFALWARTGQFIRVKHACCSELCCADTYQEVTGRAA